jgi:hypothetical protein
MNWNLYDINVQAMVETCHAKNEAYGDSFNLSLDKYGAIAGLVRIEDKINRLSNLISNGGHEHDEAIDDTCIDAANYLLMLATWLLERKDNAQGASPDQGQFEPQGLPLPPYDELIERCR